MPPDSPRNPVELVFATPRKLPKAASLPGRVVVLDMAFASEASGGGFNGITRPFIEALGSRLGAWVDHHDHREHARYAHDPRFVLATKMQHPACPEMITPQLVQRVGPVNCVVCHTDFDGLASAAKWLRDGQEPYPGCDGDARAIDTRLGTPSETACCIDRALRARPRDNGLFGIVVQHLRSGLRDPSMWVPIRAAAAQLDAIEQATRKLAVGYVRLDPGVAVVDITGHTGPLDKTLLLLLGQARERIAMIIDGTTINLATPFDSGLNLLAMLGLSGGMPTRVSVPRGKLDLVCQALGLDPSQVAMISGHR